MNQKDFFNSLAENWDNICNHDTNKIKYLLQTVGIIEGSKILDVGTGTGVLIPFLSEIAGKSGKITAVDISEKMIEVAERKNKYENVSFICGDILSTDIHKNSFDFVICFSMFPHFKDKQLAISVLSGLLKKQGKLVICHSQSREAINNLHKKSSEPVRQDDLPSTDVIKAYFEESGLRNVFQIDDDEMFEVIGQKM